MEKTYMKPFEAWKYCCMGKTDFWARVRREEIPAVRLGPKKVLFRVKDLDRYMEQHLVGLEAGDGWSPT